MNKLNIVFATVAIAFGSGCFYLLHNLRTEQARADHLQLRIDELERSQKSEPRGEERVVEAAAPTALDDTVAHTQLSPAPPPPPPAPAKVMKPAALARNAAVRRQRQALANPAYRDAMRAMHRTMIEQENPELAEALNLSPDEADRFLNLLADEVLREQEQEGVYGEKKLTDLAQPERRRKGDERQRQIEAERADLLGELRLQEWKKYQQSKAARAQVRELRSNLGASAFPLRDDQVEPLIASIAAEQQRHQADRAKLHGASAWTDDTTEAERLDYMEQRKELIDESLTRTYEIARAHLDSTQLRRFNELLERDRNRARIELELWRAQAKLEQ